MAQNAMFFVSVCRCVCVSTCVCASLLVCLCVCAGSWQRFGPCWNFGHADRWARIIKRKSEHDIENERYREKEKEREGGGKY